MAGKLSDIKLADEIERRTGARFARMTISNRRARCGLPNRWGAPQPEPPDAEYVRDIVTKKLENFIPEPNSGCWLWLGSVNALGYGMMSAPGRGAQAAYRMAWEMANGPIPKGMCVCHKCDVPSCINPQHLWLGTHIDNMADKYRKGRSNNPKGEAHGRAKLTEEAVREIRISPRAPKVIAAKYGVSPTQIYAIRAGLRWTHVR